MVLTVMDQSEREPYGYTPFPSDPDAHRRPWIRLVRIASLATDNEPANVELKFHQVSDTSQYDCLSYTWGDPIYRDLTEDGFETKITNKRDQVIHCHGRRLFVTQNLVDALQTLGKNGYAPGDQRWLWIDAICINQDSKPEINLQVPLMGCIYKHAKRVVIWLGRDDLHSPHGSIIRDLLGSPHAKIPPPGTTFNRLDDEALWTVLCGDALPKDRPLLGDQEWISYCAFLQRPWFGRMWVLQESFFAQKRIALLGNAVFPWETIERSADLIHSTNLLALLKEVVRRVMDGSQQEFIDRRGRNGFANRLNNQRIFRVLHRDASPKLSLGQILYHVRFFECSEPKDYIYGVLGLWEEAQAGRDRCYTITPEYGPDCPLWQVYAEATWLAILDAGNLSVLGLLENPLAQQKSSQDPDWPTWVPAYNKGVDMIPLEDAKLRRGREVEDFQRSRQQEWHASDGLKFRPPQSPRGGQGWRKLPVDGLQVDQVCLLGPTYRETVVFGLFFLLNFLDKDPIDSPHLDVCNESPVDALVRTMIKDTFRGCCPSSSNPGGVETIRTAFHAFMTNLIRELQQEIINWEEHAAQLSNLTATSTEEEEDDPQDLTDMLDCTWDLIEELHERFSAPLFTSSSLASSKGPAPFPSCNDIETMIALEDHPGDATSEEEKTQIKLRVDFDEAFRVASGGRRLFRTQKGYFGIAAESVNEGDDVYILAGASVPVVLRRAEGGAENERRVVGEAYMHGLMNGEVSCEPGAELVKLLLI